MSTPTSRTLIAVLQVTLDGHILGPEGEVDWVDSWADGLHLLPPVDAFVLGGGMFPEYERFWATLLDDPTAAADMLGRDPYPRELATRASPPRPRTSCSRRRSPRRGGQRRGSSATSTRSARCGQRPGNAVYVVGGPGLIASLIDAQALDELRLIVHPVLATGGTPFSDKLTRRHALELVAADPTASGRVNLTYRLAASTDPLRGPARASTTLA